MNLYTGSIKSSRRTAGNKKKAISKLWLAVNLIVFMAAIFFIANYRISLNDNLSRLERESETITRQLSQLEREIENFNIYRENLCKWEYIRDKVNKFKLSLKVPEPEQVMKLAIHKDGDLETGETSPVSHKINLSQR